MLKIDIISGFLGAGKTTFIKRLLKTKKFQSEKVVLIENEFGEISIDGDFLRDAKIDIKELSQGCICCSLVGDFSKSLNQVIEEFNPDRIIIEPSGVGKLSDIKQAVVNADLGQYLNSFVCLVDAKRANMYLKNFGEFFKDQIKEASVVVLSRTDIASEENVKQALEIVRSLNEKSDVVTTPIDLLSDEDLFNEYEGTSKDFLADVLKHLDGECDDPECECHHHHHHHDDDDDDEDEHECCHHHHHHDDDDDDEDEHECCHHHHHDHDEDEEECECHHHHHHHHHHGHDADEVFESVGIESVKKYDLDALVNALNKLANTEDFGIIVRAKGIVNTNTGWKEFNLSPNEVSVLDSKPFSIGKIVVIGSKIKEEEIKNLF